VLAKIGSYITVVVKGKQTNHIRVSIMAFTLYFNFAQIKASFLTNRDKMNENKNNIMQDLIEFHKPTNNKNVKYFISNINPAVAACTHTIF